MWEKVSTTDSPSPVRGMLFALFFLYCNTILSDQKPQLEQKKLYNALKF